MGVEHKMKEGLLLLFIGFAAGAGHGFYHHGHHGYHGYLFTHPKCTKEIETVTKNLCRIEVEKSCETVTKKFFKITGFEDKDCKEVDVCKHPHGYHGYHGYHHGYHGKREAHAPVKCETEKKEICKKVPVKEEVSKDIEFCKGKPKKVCEDKEIKVPKIKCEKPKAKEEE